MSFARLPRPFLSSIWGEGGEPGNEANLHSPPWRKIGEWEFHIITPQQPNAILLHGMEFKKKAEKQLVCGHRRNFHVLDLGGKLNNIIV